MKKYFIILNVLLITGMLYFSVKAFYRIATAQLDYGSPAETVNREVTSSENETRQPLAHYDPIIKRNLFNTKEEEKVEEKKEEPEEKNEELEETKLKLKLWGTFTGDTEEAYAIIENIKEKNKAFTPKGIIFPIFRIQ